MGWPRRVCAVVVCVLLAAQPSWGGAKAVQESLVIRGIREDMIAQFTGTDADPVNIFDATYANIELSQAMVTEATVEMVPKSLETLGFRSKSDINDVLKALKVATSWGNVQSLDAIARALRENKRVAIADGTGAGLGDILYYLYVMKCKEEDTSSDFIYRIRTGGDVETSHVPGPREVVLLDTITLRRLETVPAFREHVASNLDKFVFAAPYAWTGGFHMFKSARTFGDFSWEFSQKFMKEYRSDDCTVLGRHNFECALDRVFKDPVLERLQAAIPELTEDNVLWLKRYNPRHPLSASVTARDVYLNLRPSLPSADDLKNFAEQVRPCVQEGSSDFEKDRSVMNFISNYQNINTMPAVLETARSLMTQVLAKDGTGFDFQKVVIPTPGKSTCIIVHAIFSLYEDLDASMIHHMSWYHSSFRNGVGDDMRRLLIVDDLALSGTQLKDWALTYGGVKGVEEARAGALFVSPVAEKMFRREKLNVYVGKALRKPPPPQMWMVEPGFLGGREAFALQWMAPDNNFRTFRQLLAPKVTFHGKGVKLFDEGWTMPDCTAWSQRQRVINWQKLQQLELEQQAAAIEDSTEDNDSSFEVVDLP